MKSITEKELEKLCHRIWRVSTMTKKEFVRWQLEEIARLSSQPDRGMFSEMSETKTGGKNGDS